MSAGRPDRARRKARLRLEDARPRAADVIGQQALPLALPREPEDGAAKGYGRKGRKLS